MVTKSNLGRKGCLGRNLETGTEAENTEETLLAGSTPIACSACFITPPRTPCPAVAMLVVG